MIIRDKVMATYLRFMHSDTLENSSGSIMIIRDKAMVTYVTIIHRHRPDNIIRGHHDHAT